jgi:hypothetical protein
MNPRRPGSPIGAFLDLAVSAIHAACVPAAAADQAEAGCVPSFAAGASAASSVAAAACSTASSVTSRTSKVPRRRRVPRETLPPGNRRPACLADASGPRGNLLEKPSWLTHLTGGRLTWPVYHGRRHDDHASPAPVVSNCVPPGACRDQDLLAQYASASLSSCANRV